MTPEQIEEHDRVFQEAVQLVEDEIIVRSQPQGRIYEQSVRRKLDQSLRLFARVLKLNPENWSALWLGGKVYQCVGDYHSASKWFVQAHKINPSQPDVNREASICAMELGLSDDAIFFARSAIECQPNDNGLQANLALALLLGGRLSEAKSTLDQAVIKNPTDHVFQTVRSIIEHFNSTGQKPPNTISSLEEYWKDRSSGPTNLG